jgi:hypothetical protein
MSGTYRIRAIVEGEVEVDEDCADELKEALETGDPKKIGEFFDEFDHTPGDLIDNDEVPGWEIVDPSGIVIAKMGQEVPLTVKV